MKRTTSAIALVAASILGLTACGSGSDPLTAETTAAATGARPEPAAGGSATEDTRATLVGGSE